MGREIRRVPVGWEHPWEMKPHWRTGIREKSFQPLYDHDAEMAWADWLKEFEEFKKEELARIVLEYPDEGYSLDEPYRSFCKWSGEPPDPACHRPKWPEGAELGFAVYETVSEGTPVTPTFATKAELIDYLATKGTYWDDGKPWAREAAERFVEAEWAPSMIAMVSDKGAQIIMPNDPAMYDAA
jgi:hypothetical protein